jgi:hypothetical protein
MNEEKVTNESEGLSFSLSVSKSKKILTTDDFKSLGFKAMKVLLNFAIIITYVPFIASGTDSLNSLVRITQEVKNKSAFSYQEMIDRSRVWEGMVKNSKTEDELTKHLNDWFAESLSRIKNSIIFNQFPLSFQHEVDFLISKASRPNFKYYGCNKLSTVALTDGDYIKFCDVFFKDYRTVGENLNTLIHEYVHMLGYDHGANHSRRTQILYTLTSEIKGSPKWKKYDAVAGNQVFTKKELGIIASRKFLKRIQKMDRDVAESKWLSFLKP